MTPAPFRPCIVVAGPTASGKSELALALARAFKGAVINADSMQVYRGLRILSAAPDPAAAPDVPHYLFGVLDPAEPCNAGRWRDMAVAALDKVWAGDRVPVVVGGTGLYLRALIEGIASMPDIPAALRARLRERHAREGTSALYDELARRDPETAARLRPRDTHRILRALEVLEATGRPLAHWQSGRTLPSPPGIAFAAVLLMPPRDTLVRAIEDRFHRMVDAGALDEARALAARGLDLALPAAKALGVPELMAHARGALALDAAVAAAVASTRRYAKRQRTWFRHQFRVRPGEGGRASPDRLRVWDEKFSERIQGEIFTFIRQFLLTLTP